MPSAKWAARGLAFLVAAGASAGAASQLRPKPATPPRVAHPPQLDLGERDLGELAVGRFAIRNAGGSILKVNSFATSCSCAGVERDEGGKFVPAGTLTVEPGGEAELAVRVATGAKVGTSQTVQVVFTCNDPERPLCSMEVVIPRVKGGVHVQPSVAVFGEVPLGKPEPITLAVFDNGIASRRVASVKSLSPERFVAKLIPLAGAPAKHATAGTQIASVEVTPVTGVAGKLGGQVEITVEGADGKIAAPDRFDVVGEVVGPVSCRPDCLVLPRTTGGKPVFEGEVVLSGRDGLAINPSVGTLPEGIAVELRRVGESEVVAKVRVTPGAVGRKLVPIAVNAGAVELVVFAAGGAP